MKTTIDLPDDLMHRIKLRAVHEHKKLKHSIAELLERGLARSDTSGRLASRPKPLRLRNGSVPSVREIETAIAHGRD